ncbi:MAG TPA: tetratricopeptide repeat protein [Roseiflexaceae bacterium]
MTTEDASAFHRRVAEELVARYGASGQAPQDWREALAWHWEQAGAYAEAAEAALEIAEARMTRLNFTSARRWAERTLSLIERLDAAQRRIYDLRAYALALAVLEFGGQYREGLDYARRMLSVAQARNNREATARAYLAVGRMQRELGQLATAEVVLQQARALAADDELGELEAEVRLHLAKVHLLQGRHLEALQELQLAQEETEQHDDRFRLARVFTGIGDIYRVLGSSREAMTFYTRALSLEQGRGSLLGQAILRDKLALALLEQNKLAEALADEEESLRLRQSISDVVGQARSYSVLGTIMGRLGRYEEAQAYHEQALAIEEQLQNPRGQGIALLHLGDTARATHQYDRAREYYTKALAVTRRDNDQIGLARALERTGDLYYDEGRRERANAHWVEALKIREGLHHSEESAALRERIRGGRPPRR